MKAEPSSFGTSAWQYCASPDPCADQGLQYVAKKPSHYIKCIPMELLSLLNHSTCQRKIVACGEIVGDL